MNVMNIGPATTAQRAPLNIGVTAMNIPHHKRIWRHEKIKHKHFYWCLCVQVSAINKVVMIIAKNILLSTFLEFFYYLFPINLNCRHLWQVADGSLWCCSLKFSGCKILSPLVSYSVFSNNTQGIERQSNAPVFCHMR
jgi:hypothetical protein